MNLKPFKIVLLEYQESDPFGPFMCIASLAPWIILCFYISLILFKRDMTTLLAFIGQLINELLNVILKKSLKHPRPNNGSLNSRGYGMPSSHAQFMGFLMIFYILLIHHHFDFTFKRSAHKPNSSNKTKSQQIQSNKIYKALLYIGLMTSSLIVSWSRIHLRYHTLLQVQIGFILGVFMGVFWFNIGFPTTKTWFKSSFIKNILNYLYFKDSLDVPNILSFEKEAVEGFKETLNLKNK